jgi:hypothetical protein
MAIFKGSRYYYSEIEYLSLNENEASNPVVWYQFPSGGLSTFTIHVVVEGERLDEISYKYYERPSFWWKILESNPHVTDIMNIPAGTILRVPQ